MFRDVEQEERIVDESRKAFLASKTKCLKLQKQLEHSRKKNDTTKVQSLEIELTTVSRQPVTRLTCSDFFLIHSKGAYESI